jgi:hypothetical protein
LPDRTRGNLAALLPRGLRRPHEEREGQVFGRRGVQRQQPDPGRRHADAGPPQGVEHRIQPQQGLPFLGPVADQRQAGDQFAVVVQRPGTSEQEGWSGEVGLAERDGPKVVQPEEDPAADPLVVGVVAWVVE